MKGKDGRLSYRTHHPKVGGSNPPPAIRAVNKRPFFIALIITALVVVAEGGQKSTFDVDRQVQEVKERIKSLTEDFRAIRGITTDADPIHLRIRGEIDGYIRTAFSPAQTTSSDVEGRLRAVLADHIPNPAFGDEAFARVKDLRRGRSLVVAFTVTRPPHHDLATIRGYRSVQGRFELVAATGGDFADFNMFKAEIPSPISDELWLLAWGQGHTSNGQVIRFRAYSFDGGTFKTLWSPENFFDATVTVTNRGFLIEHRSPFNAPYRTKDEYLMTPGGPVKARN